MNKQARKSLVGIVMGSDSDLEIVQEAAKILEEFGVAFEMTIISAHRTPDRAVEYSKTAVSRGLKVIIAGAGGAAHLAGVIAAHFPGPVIGIPIKTPTLNGLDSLYAIVQMPAGVPVATVAINGAKNAALLAVQILAVDDKGLLKKLMNYKANLAQAIVKKNSKLKTMGIAKYLGSMKV